MPKDIKELEDIFDSAISTKNTNIRGLGKSVLGSLKEKYGDGLEEFLYEGKGACNDSGYARHRRSEPEPYDCSDDEELARIIWENKKDDPDCYKGSKNEKGMPPRGNKPEGGPTPLDKHPHATAPVNIDGFEKRHKKGMGKKQLTAFLLKVTSNLDEVDDDVFTIFYLQLSKEFEKRFHVEGVCDTLNGCLGVQECVDAVDVELQKVAEST
jgi:hypothetical protein